MELRFLVVPHTHWDREWYLPFEEFRLRLAEVVDEVLDVLDRDPAFTSFTLDGQAIVIEDYLEARPEREPQLRALLAAGRLEVGPSYVLPDELLVGGEPLVRNLLLGRRACRRFGGEPSPVGYLPDSFGHPAQLPQLLAGFGIHTFLFSRGLGDELDEVGVLFRWRADDGSEVVAHQLLPHYDNFALMRSVRQAGERAEKLAARFGGELARAGCDTLVLCNGSDHLPIEPELPRWLGELGPRFRIGRYSDFRPAADGLPAHEGELVGSRLQNVLRGVNSARMYLKQANERAERRLLAIETLAALRTLRDGGPFPHEDFRLAWRDLLRNHPHDSICGCSCDEVHRDMLGRWERLHRTLDVLERRAVGDGAGGALVNPLPYRRARLVDGSLVELDGFAAAPVQLEPLPEPATRNGRAIEGERFRVEVADDGTFSVTDLESGTRLDGLHAFEDEPDAGDLYTFCPDPGAPCAHGRLVDARVLRDGPLVRELELDVELAGVFARTTVRLVDGIERIELRTVLKNRAPDHRLRVAFPVATDATAVRAESQFAVAHRPLARREPRAPWVEPPVPTAHTLGAVALGPLALLAKGLPEYEARPGGSLRLTLLRCVGTISRPPGLATRRLAAGPEVATPEGQCLGTHVFEYAIRLDAKELSDAELVRASQDYRFDFHSAPADLASEPALALSGGAVFAALKGAEDGDGVVLRVYNPLRESARFELDREAARLSLDEERPADGGLELAPGAIATFRLGSHATFTDF